jgi:hypothetical protein
MLVCSSSGPPWLRWWEDLVGGVVSTVAGALDQGGRARLNCAFPAPVASQSTRWLNRPQMPRFEKTFARRKRPLSPRVREALELLASDPLGASEAFMHGHGFSLRTLVGLAHARLATVQREIVIAAGERVVATRIKITDAGRKAIE